MINSEFKTNGQGNSGADTHTSLKQSPMTTKKMVLADVQNDNRSVLHNRQENSLYLGGEPIVEKVKVSGTKRLIPEFPSSHAFRPLLNHTAAKEHLISTGKSELEPENEKLERIAKQIVSSASLKRLFNLEQEIYQKQTQMMEDSLRSSIANSNNGVGAAENDCPKVTSKVPQFADSKRVDDQNINQKWEERFINLQNFLKKCDDESTYRAHTQKLRHLSPAELSMYAVELERKAIQLTIEEGKELQRMKALKVLEKSAATTNQFERSQPSQPKK